MISMNRNQKQTLLLTLITRTEPAIESGSDNGMIQKPMRRARGGSSAKHWQMEVEADGKNYAEEELIEYGPRGVDAACRGWINLEEMSLINRTRESGGGGS